MTASFISELCTPLALYLGAYSLHTVRAGNLCPQHPVTPSGHSLYSRLGRREVEAGLLQTSEPGNGNARVKKITIITPQQRFKASISRPTLTELRQTAVVARVYLLWTLRDHLCCRKFEGNLASPIQGKKDVGDEVCRTEAVWYSSKVFRINDSGVQREENDTL